MNFSLQNPIISVRQQAVPKRMEAGHAHAMYYTRAHIAVTRALG